MFSNYIIIINHCLYNFIIFFFLMLISFLMKLKDHIIFDMNIFEHNSIHQIMNLILTMYHFHIIIIFKDNFMKILTLFIDKLLQFY